VKIVLRNGELTTDLPLTDEIRFLDNVLTLNPLRNQKIVLYVHNDSAAFDAQAIEVNFRHPGAKVDIYGLISAQHQEKLSMKTVMRHEVSDCESKQLWKGILKDASKVDFEGKILVAKETKKTVAQLTNKNLLLSDDAEIKTKPFLEIYADDVQCSHGATVGCLDKNAIFYLRSRGISEEQAKLMLIEAFVAEVMECNA